MKQTLIGILIGIEKTLHNILGWGFPADIVEGDSFQPVYCCKFCDRALLQDSTGTWFHLERSID